MASLSPKMNKRSIPTSPSDTADSRPAKKQVVDGLPAAASLSGQATASEEATMAGAKEIEEEDEEGAMSAPVASSSTAPASDALNKAANPHGPKPKAQYGRDKKPKKDNKDWNAKKSNTWMSRNNEAKEAQAAGSDDEGAVDGEGKKRLPKKKAAILIGYCGAGYSGMQIQVHDSKTIEGDVFEALTKAGAVSTDNATDHRKVDVARAARTDAGVHAAGNVISMKLIIEPPLPEGFDTLASYVNSFLPPQIRMWGFVRTMKSFQARTACDSRKYEYLLPSYCLLPPRSGDVLSRTLDKSSPGWREALGPAAEFADAGLLAAEGTEGAPEVDEAKPDDEIRVDKKMRGEFERKRGWRVDTQTLDRFKGLIAKYKGTHNFHNYTLGKPFNDRSVKRHMLSLVVNEPVVVGEIEWISVQIHGQSFMLHQIRKMLSLAILACRTGTPSSLIPETFGPKRIHIPKAPPLGLLLEAPQFGMYNTRIGSKKNGLQVDRDPIDWDVYADVMRDFKLKHIYEKLRQDELETHVFHKWIRQMDATETDILAFLNSKGTIPPEAEVGKRAEAEREAKRVEEGGAAAKDLESEDEEVDQDLLKRGELEG